MANAYNSTIRNARMQAVIDEAGTGALIKLYNGTRPANGGAISSQTLIAELSNAGSLGSVSGGVLTMDTITGDASANASGTPTWCRILKSDGTTFVADFDTAGLPAATSGQPYDLTSFTVTEGNA
jgi:hypothetical protein